MNSKRILYIGAFALAAVVNSCKKDDFKDEDTNQVVQPIALSVQMNPLVVNGDTLPVTNTLVKITNMINNAEYALNADSTGLVVFDELLPGKYSINASLTMTAAQYNAITGGQETEDISFNQALSNQDLHSDTTLHLDLLASKVGDWVIKQLYYTGSNITTGASFRDVFVEIYNNSNTVLYADSLVIAEAYGKLSNAAAINLQDNGQYDWSMSIGNNVSNDANNDYIYAAGMYMIPSNATKTRYPVEPGQSIIIAATGIDHTGTYNDVNGDPVAVIDPNLTVNLANADFEVFAYPYKLVQDPTYTQYKFDLDNPNVTNISILHLASGQDFVMDALGRESYVIVEPSAAFNYGNIVKVPHAAVTSITSTTSFYARIPVANVIDGVELQHPVSSNRMPRRLPTSIDAGAYNVPNGQYSSQSAVRKTKKIVDGRRILQDTNNSAVDFGFLNKADASKSASSFID